MNRALLYFFTSKVWVFLLLVVLVSTFVAEAKSLEITTKEKEISNLSFLTDLSVIDIPGNDTLVYYDTIFIYDTIYVYESVYDTIFVYDTVYVYDIEKLEANKASLQTAEEMNSELPISSKDQSSFYSNWQNISLELFASSFAHKNNISLVNENNILLDKRKESITTNQGYSFGANINYQISKNRYFQTGIEYSHFSENVNLHHAYSLFDTSTTIERIPYDLLVIDTVWFLNVDSLLAGVNWYEAYQDSNYLHLESSDTTTIINKQNKTINQSKVSSWSYFEIPVIGALQLRSKQWTFDLKGGLITGFLLKYQRYMVYPEGDLFEVREVSSTELSNVVFNAYLATNVAYQFNSHWTVLCEPYLKYPLAELSKASAPILRTQQTGLRLGVKYNF